MVMLELLLGSPHVWTLSSRTRAQLDRALDEAGADFTLRGTAHLYVCGHAMLVSVGQHQTSCILLCTNVQVVRLRACHACIPTVCQLYTSTNCHFNCVPWCLAVHFCKSRQHAAHSLQACRPLWFVPVCYEGTVIAARIKGVLLLVRTASEAVPSTLICTLVLTYA